MGRRLIPSIYNVKHTSTVCPRYNHVQAGPQVRAVMHTLIVSPLRGLSSQRRSSGGVALGV
jgi:hypothetical protein